MTARLQIIQAWPAQMSADTACAYLDISRGAFDNGIKLGRYPSPRHHKGEGRRWLKKEIDAHLAHAAESGKEESEFE